MTTTEQKIRQEFPELMNEPRLLNSLMAFLLELNPIANKISELLGDDEMVVTVTRVKKL